MSVTHDALEVRFEAGRPRLTCGSGIATAARGDARIAVEGPLFRLAVHEPALVNRSADERAGALLDRWLERGPPALVDAVGDFVAVVVTPVEATAFKPLTSSRQLFARAGRLSNRLRAIASDCAEGDLDPEYLMRLIMVAPGLQYSLQGTPFRGVDRLLPWHLLTMTDAAVSQRQIQSRDYRYREDPGQRAQDVARAVLETLTTCVEDRVAICGDRKVCCEISGGLDSSFVACLAGQATSGVVGYMFSNPDKPSHRFGEDAARAVAERHHIDLQIVAPRDLEVPDLSQVAEPWEEPTDFFWYGPMFGPFTAHKLPERSLVMTGYAGDALFMRSPLVLPYLLQTGRKKAFFQQLRRFSKLSQRSTVSLASQSALSLMSPARYLKLAGAFSGKKLNPLEVLDITADWKMREPIDWLRGSRDERVERQRQSDVEGAAADEGLIGGGIVRDDSISYLAHRRVVIGPWLGGRGIEEQSPFCDIRMFDLMYGGVRWDLVHDFAGPYKSLMREAQRGVVPELVRTRSEDVFVFDTFRRRVLDANESFLEGLLDHPLVDDRRFDRDGLRQAFQRLVFGHHDSSIRGLYQLLGYLLWWRVFTDRD